MKNVPVAKQYISGLTKNFLGDKIRDSLKRVFSQRDAHMHHSARRSSALLLILLFVAACSSGPRGHEGAIGAQGAVGEDGKPGRGGADGANGTNGVDGGNSFQGPLIDSLAVAGSPAAPGGFVSAMVTARSGISGGTLSYQWVSTGGFSVVGANSGATVVLKAPVGYAAEGTVAVTVADNWGNLAQGLLVVATKPNNSPVIQAISVNPGSISKGSTVTVSVTAFDSDGDPLAVWWAVPSGWNASVTTGTTLIVDAPSLPGERGDFAVYVSDGNVTLVEPLVVTTDENGRPVVQSVAVWGSPALLGGVISIEVFATDPESDALSYSWSQTSGWNGSSSTSGLNIEAPYAYGVTGAVWGWVSDPWVSTGFKVGVATVANVPPFLTSVVTAPQPLRGNGTFSAAATDIYGDSLTYAWFVDDVFVGNGAVLPWAGPNFSSERTLRLEVSDGYGGAVSAQSTLQVASIHPWPRGKYDQRGSGQTINLGPAAINAVSSYTVGFVVEGVPAISNSGNVYFGAHDGYLYCVSSDLALQWRFNTGGDIYGDPLLLADGSVIVGSFGKKLYAISETGQEKWSYAIGNNMIGSPNQFDDGLLVVGDMAGNLFGLGAAGSFQWSAPVTGAIQYGPTLSPDGAILFGTSAGGVYSYNANGTLRWAYQFGATVSSAPAVDREGRVFIGAQNGNVYALSASGAPLWSYPTTDVVRRSPVVSKSGHVYVGSYDGNLYALNATSGTLRWKLWAGSRIGGDPAIDAEERIYFGTMAGRIYSVNHTGSVRWMASTGDVIYGSPSIGENARVYIGSSGLKRVWMVR